MSLSQRLDAVCEISMGQAPSGDSYNYDGEGWPLIAGAGDFGELYPVVKKYTTAASRLSKYGDIVLGIRASIGEKVIADGEYCLGRGVAGLRAKSNLVPGYLWHWLTYAGPRLASKAKGATFKQVNKDDIGELEVVTPPLPEQRRIAAILDQADALRAKRREALVQLDGLTQSIFIEMFGDPVTNSMKWDCKPLSEIGKVITGNTPSREVSAYYGDAIEWIKSDNINTPHYYLTTASEGLSESGKRVGRTVPALSILVTCIAGSPDCIGNAAMTDREVAFNQQINAFVPVDVDSHFAYVHILVGKRLIQDASTNGMKGMVSKSRFEKIEMMLPPRPLQEIFATRAQTVEAMKLAQQASLAQLNNLFFALQHRAFRGEL